MLDRIKEMFADSRRNRLAMFAACGIVIFYFIGWGWNAVNIPYKDDSGRIFRFLQELDEKESFAEKATYLLTDQSNEHRIVTFRLIVLAVLKTMGHVDLRVLMLVGSAALLGIGWIFFWSVRLEKSERYLLFPLVLLLFVPLQEISNWGLNLTAYLVYFFAFAALYLLHKSGESGRSLWFWIAALAAILAACTFGSGLFVFVAAYVLLIFPRISWWKIVAWTIITGITFALYFRGLDLPEHRLGVTASLSHHAPSIIGFFFTFVGAGFKDLFHSPFPELLMGVGIILGLALLIKKHFALLRAQPLLLAYLAYLLIFFVPTSINRGYHGLAGANADRYQVVPAIFLSVSYLLLLSVHTDWLKKNFWFVLAFSMLLFASRTSYNLERMSVSADVQRRNLLNYHLGEKDIDGIATGVMRKAVEKGHYRSPAESIWHRLNYAEIKLQPTENQPLFAKMHCLRSHDGWTEARGYALFQQPELQTATTQLLLLAPDGSAYIVECRTIPDSTFLDDESLGKGKSKLYNTFSAGFTTVINHKLLQIPAGEYQVGVYLNDGVRVGYEMFDETLTIH
jgi:hypothetical protein